MTLNDTEWSVCVKIWSELDIQWAGVLAFGENYSEICRATHMLSAEQKYSPVTVLVIVLWGYSLGLPEEEASNQWIVFTLTVLTHAVH